MLECFAAFGNETVCAYVARRMEAIGVRRVEDASRADVVFTYYANATALEDAYFDDEGLIKNARAHTLLVDLSPCAPSFAREVSAVASVNGFRPIEAPLAIIDPTLPDAFSTPENVICFLAGEADDVDAARAIVGELADDVRFTGGFGSAQLAKAAHTVQQAAQLSAAIECDEIVRAHRASSIAGDVFEAGPETLSELSGLLLAAVRAESFEGTYTIEMLMGEVVAAMTAADDVEIILPQLEAIMHLLEIVAIIGGADMAPAALSLVYRDEALAAEHGLDWSRAEGLFAEHGHDHDPGGADDGDDWYDYGDMGYAGGYGGYSAN